MKTYKDATKVIQRIHNYEWVSFDIFDTLLKRDVTQPTVIFDIMQEKGLKYFGNQFNKFSFLRQQAERQARNNSSREITLIDIYHILSKDFSPNEISWAIEKEKELELLYCSPNLKVKPIYDYCLKNNKRIEIISDMYLPKSLIEKMLFKIGITKWDHLFLSSELGVRKADGSLFQFVLKTLGIKASQLIHVGDNIDSDYNIPKSIGINVIHVPTLSNNLTYYFTHRKINLADNVAISYLNNKVLSLKKSQRLGFETFGPLLYGVTSWIVYQLNQDKINKVYFLSRDGLIIKKAFDLINKDHRFQTEYLFASRRALQVPLLYNESVSYVKFVHRLFWPEHFTFKYFLKSLGLEKEETIKYFSAKYKTSLDTQFNSVNISQNVFLKGFFNNERIVIKKNAQTELINIKKYLSSKHLKDKAAIVDIGWHGNMQLNLESILNEIGQQCKITGLYVGIVPHENHSKLIDMKGYCFDDSHGYDLYLVERRINSLFEQVFMADHGSLKCFDHDGQPVLYPFEQDDKNMIKLMNEYQSGALKFVKGFFDKYGILNTSNLFAIDGVIKQFYYPTYAIAAQWGKVRFKDVGEESLVHGKQYMPIFHPIRTVQDYKQSIWPQGFLKYHFKLDLDYSHFIYHKPEVLRKIIYIIKKIQKN